MTTVRGKIVPALNTCPLAYRQRGLPAEDWNGLEALTFPGICDDCRDDVQNLGARYEAILERKHAEQGNLQRIFEKYNVPVRGESPFRHIESLLRNSHADAWLHAEASLAVEIPEAKETWFCERLNELIGKSAFYRRYVALHEPERINTEPQ
ncbi:hypothetical protein NEMBOFW57_007683 [Staphylotrichum longicolle]|uniref:Uncharacterized protein n=1 Tax=Staphylotrichum longicolle TaxID=669026 RepID=A0AAD4EZL6_9PEZI|nr:hypothetical protein NEMBOFW57_007683 [Staphylotrichum longicolle]